MLVYHHHRSTVTSLILIGSPPQLFKDDIMYLLTMDKLWKKRKAPTPLDWQQLENSGMSVFNIYVRDNFSFWLDEVWGLVCCLLVPSLLLPAVPKLAPATAVMSNHTHGIYSRCF